MKLIIGNKRYSSWSLRPWALLKEAGIDFEEVKVYLYKGNFKEEILKYSPAGKVPILIDEDVSVWESLAICEYIADKFPEKKLWPQDIKARAVARSISHEMHAGFGNLRQNFPMNCCRQIKPASISAAVKDDIARIENIWESCRKAPGLKGEFLFGTFGVADAMYAPIAFRFWTYGVALSPVAERYKNKLLDLASMKLWVSQAQKEKELIEKYEP